MTTATGLFFNYKVLWIYIYTLKNIKSNGYYMEFGKKYTQLDTRKNLLVPELATRCGNSSRNLRAGEELASSRNIGKIQRKMERSYLLA